MGTRGSGRLDQGRPDQGPTEFERKPRSSRSGMPSYSPVLYAELGQS
jgi:hypothetical protein